MPASERCSGSPSALPTARVLGGQRINFGKECDVPDDVGVTLPNSRLPRQASFCQKSNDLCHPAPLFLTLLLFLLTGWFSASECSAATSSHPPSTISNPPSLQGYAYQLDRNGNRTHITELSGRNIAHTFDSLHRLTSETISSSLITDHFSLGTLSYTYDAASNRTSRTATGTISQLLPNQTQTFTANDRLTTDTYDANGNTTSSLLTSHSALGTLSATDVYSFDNKLIRRTRADGVTIDLTYNPDGHRLTKLVSQSGLTQRVHHYLTDPNSPTGYSQVIEETDPLAPGGQQLQKVHLYGHDLISSLITDHSALITSHHFYTYDGLGSVRGITNETGDLEETYDYDAYGTLIGLAKRNAEGVLESTPITNNQSLITKSESLFTGEQFDSDLGMYFLRARYLNTQTGRFHTQDTYEGRNGEPLTLHKYVYANGDPVMGRDPSGEMTLLVELASAQVGALELAALDTERVLAERKIMTSFSRQIMGKFHTRLGRAVEDDVYRAIQKFGDDAILVRNREKLSGPLGNSIVDITAEYRDVVVRVEIKHKLPSRTGDQLDRLVKQLDNMERSPHPSGKPTKNILVTYRMPSVREIGFVNRHLSPEAELIQSAYGMQAMEQHLLTLANFGLLAL